MSRLAGLVAGKGPGAQPGPIRELSHDSQLSRELPPEIAPPDRRESRTFAKIASFAEGKGQKTQETSLLFHNNNKEILSLSCARGNEFGEGPPAKVAIHAKVKTAPRSLAPALESEPRRRWLIRLADGWRDSTFTPPATLLEVRAQYPAALAMEPEEDAPQSQEPAPAADFEALPDDRITCRACRHLAGTRCQVAQRGAFSHRARWYEPEPERLRACYLFAPLPHDPDQRAGAARWPSLEWMKRREN